jgi:hypothetical protein
VPEAPPIRDLRPPAPGRRPVTANLRRSAMWYLIFLLVGVVLGSLATFLWGETRCRECSAREDCEQFP